MFLHQLINIDSDNKLNSRQKVKELLIKCFGYYSKIFLKCPTYGDSTLYYSKEVPTAYLHVVLILGHVVFLYIYFLF